MLTGPFFLWRCFIVLEAGFEAMEFPPPLRTDQEEDQSCGAGKEAFRRDGGRGGAASQNWHARTSAFFAVLSN